MPIKQVIETLVENYKPNKTFETDIKMMIVLKQTRNIYQRTRHLSTLYEKNIVNIQIEE